MEYTYSYHSDVFVVLVEAEKLGGIAHAQHGAIDHWVRTVVQFEFADGAVGRRDVQVVLEAGVEVVDLVDDAFAQVLRHHEQFVLEVVLLLYVTIKSHTYTHTHSTTLNAKLEIQNRARKNT